MHELYQDEWDPTSNSNERGPDRTLRPCFTVTVQYLPVRFSWGSQRDASWLGARVRDRFFILALLSQKDKPLLVSEIELQYDGTTHSLSVGILGRISIIVECLQRVLQCLKTLLKLLGNVGLVHFFLGKPNLLICFL